ncbi:MAG: serine/threonine protein kinase, partial [Labilithrix sp.]|nr:serine/threonine protein kinase [Labilithrix sp.]
MHELAPSAQPESFGRYLLYPAIARGGMATVHTARLVGAEGFTRLVAAKRLHPQFTDDPDFVTMFHDEACIASRIHHPNVVPVLDVVVSGNELILVQEYVHGVPLSQLMKVAHTEQKPIAIDIAVAVLAGVLAGLHAAHEVRDESGEPLEIVHRDVSPANVMISVDGVPRLLDFGIAKATTSTHHTREGVFKGKLAYMAPEQLRMDRIDRTADVYATGVLAWELLVNRRVYDGRHEIAFVTAVMNGELPAITNALAESRKTMDDGRWEALVALEPIIARAMADRAEDRYATADEMLRALLDVRPSATSMAVAAWVRSAGAEFLDKRQKTLAANEESWRRTSLYTPSSGMQRVTTGSVVAAFPLPPPSAAAFPSAAPSPFATISNAISHGMPSSMSTMPSAVISAAPGAMVNAGSAAPPRESGAYRVRVGTSPLIKVANDLRTSRLLPWLAAGMFVVAGLVGGFLRGNPEAAAPAAAAVAPTTGAGTNAAPAPAGESTVTLPVVAIGNAAPASAGTGASTPAASAAASAPAPSPPPSQPSVLWRPSHVAPPPPPPRPVFVAR